VADDKQEEQRKEAARQLAEEHKQEARHPDAHRDARTSGTVTESQGRPAMPGGVPGRPPESAQTAAVANREAPHGYGQSGAAPPLDTRQGDLGIFSKLEPKSVRALAIRCTSPPTRWKVLMRPLKAGSTSFTRSSMVGTHPGMIRLTP
jgi:hypothetical protein